VTRNGGNGQPNFLARSRTVALLRLNATEARASDALERRDPSGARHLRTSIAASTDAFQWPKIMAPSVKMAVAISFEFIGL
jgi:hypothetical protein